MSRATVLLVRSAWRHATGWFIVVGRLTAGRPHPVQSPWSRVGHGVVCVNLWRTSSRCRVQWKKYGGSGWCSPPLVIRHGALPYAHGPCWSGGSLVTCSALSVAHCGHALLTSVLRCWCATVAGGCDSRVVAGRWKPVGSKLGRLAELCSGWSFSVAFLPTVGCVGRRRCRRR